MPPAWRSFEKLVARIESSLAPKGAVVKSPDRVRDLVTGRSREVDASIRFQVGSTPILITVECRRRKGVQDDTWIEQLATKRAKIGAARTIAVSHKGFSESARKTAALHGIELRNLRDRIEDELARDFLSGMKMSFVVVDFIARTVAFYTDSGPPLPSSEFSEELAEVIATGALKAPLATNPSTGEILTAEAVIYSVGDRDVPEDGTVVRKRIEAGFPAGAYQIATKSGLKPLRRIELVVDFIKRVVPAPASAFYEYSTMDETIRHVLEGRADIGHGQEIAVEIDMHAPSLPPNTK